MFNDSRHIAANLFFSVLVGFDVYTYVFAIGGSFYVFFFSLFHLLETFLSIILNSNRVRGAKEVSPFPTRVSLCVMYIALLVNVSILLCTNLHLCLKTKVYLNKFTKLYTLNDRAGHEFEAELKSKILSLIFFLFVCLFLFCLCVVCVGFRFEKASIWRLFRSLVCC